MLASAAGETVGPALRDTPDPSPPPFGAAALAGRLVELSGTGAVSSLSLACSVLREAQERGDPVAWVGTTHSVFHAPDVEEGGVDLAGLVVVWVPRVADVGRAADRLVRSGAFGVVVMDLGTEGFLPPPLESRLAGLALRHATTLLCLTDKPASSPSVGALTSLRAESHLFRLAPGQFQCGLTALKDKRHGPGWSHAETRRGPQGLR
jgi:recombination protein RecA